MTKSPPTPTVAPLPPEERFLNRELTWLRFNDRVLHEAADPRNPLLERVKFLAITGSNLDEFFMKRIGGLKQQVAAGVQTRTVDGRTPSEQIAECDERVRDMAERQQKLWKTLSGALRKEGIRIVRCGRLDAKEKALLREHYVDNVFPLVTPHAMSPSHPFPFVSNLSLNLLVTLRYPDGGDPALARVKVPLGQGIRRFVAVPGEQSRFVLLEDLMAENLDLLFPSMVIEACEVFRVIRNANTETDEEQADDLLAMIQGELRDRKIAPIVRCRIARGMDPTRRGMLAAELALDEDTEVSEVAGLIGLRNLWELVGIDRPDLHDPPHHPIDPPRLDEGRRIFDIVREHGPVLVHHPYESFDSSVMRFLEEASADPDVLAIKMTLYRSESGVIASLVDAARHGKQVTVVVELKARFDEAANIRWVAHLEEYGINVTYGVVGLKTHCKTILVVRRDPDGQLRRYAHVGTGNYHPGNARLYSDLGLFTCDPDVGHDLTELFNYLTTGYKPNRGYRKLLVAPKALKRALLAKIDREIETHRPDSPGLVQMKMNALEDADIVEALYRASAAGVGVQLIVRDTCRLRPGVPGLSDAIQVVSIVGRFLEHARIYYFRNQGDEEYFIGSADAMKRNLESRVEVLVPVEDADGRAELRALLDLQLADPRLAWDMRPDGTYEQRRPTGKGRRGRGSQEALARRAEKRLKEATRLKRRKPRGIARQA